MMKSLRTIHCSIVLSVNAYLHGISLSDRSSIGYRDESLSNLTSASFTVDGKNNKIG